MLGPQIHRCISNTAYFGPGAFDDALQRERPPRHDTIIEVVNETTLTGAYSLVSTGCFERIGVLNFASAKRPGGGFLNGSAAQEESLARSSALYVSLQQQPVFYAEHRRMKGSCEPTAERLGFYRQRRRLKYKRYRHRIVDVCGGEYRHLLHNVA